MSSQGTPEARLQYAIRKRLGREPGLVLWRNSTGVAQTEDRTIRYGLAVGSADLIGILAPAGRFIALEIKTPTGRVSEEQRLFLALVQRQGGFGAVVRSVDEAVAAIARARAGRGM